MPAIRDYAQNYTSSTSAVGFSVPVPSYSANDLMLAIVSADTGTQTWAGSEVTQYAWTAFTGGTVFADVTTAAQNATTGDTFIIDTASVLNDSFYWGSTTKFNLVGAIISTAGTASGNPVWTWEYWNGSAWTALTLLTTGLTYTTAVGYAMNRFHPPTDWATNSPGGSMATAYWARQRTTTAGNITVRQACTQMLVGRWQQLFSATNTVNHGVMWKYATASEYSENPIHYTTAETANGSITTIKDVDTLIPFSTTLPAAHTYSSSNQDSNQDVGNGTTTGVAQSFAAAASAPLAYVEFYLKKVGSPTGGAVCKLYTHSGTFGTSSVPTGVAISISNTFDVSTLTTSYQTIKFTFPWNYPLASATNYCIALEYSGGDASNYVQAGYDASSPTHGGNKSTYAPSTWTASSTQDLVFSAYQFTYGTGTATSARSALPTMTTSRNDSMVFWIAANAGTGTSTLYLTSILEGPCIQLAAKDGTANSDSIAWGMLRTAGTTSSSVYQTNLGSGTQAISTSVIGINPPSSGATVIPTYTAADSSVYITPATGAAYSTDSVPANTITTPFTGTINGVTLANGGSTVTRADTGLNTYHASINFTGLTTANQFAGIRNTIAARDLSGKNVLFHLQPYLPIDIQTTDSVALTGACGVAIGMASTTSNFKVWHVGGAGTPWGAMRSLPVVIHTSNTSGVIQSTGTFSNTSVTEFGFMVSGKVVAPNWLIASIWALDTITIAGGNALSPVDIPGIVLAASDGHERRSVLQQGSSQMMIFQPLQIGDGGTNNVYLSLDSTAIQFPEQYNKSKKIVNYCSIDNFTGLIYYPGASDTIIHTNAIISSPSRYKWGLHASASTSASYNFSGLSIIGAGTISLARAITISSITINDYSTLDISSLTLTGSTIKNPPAANDSLTVNTSTLVSGCQIYLSTVTAGNRLVSLTNPSIFSNCTFTGGGGHALRLTSAGSYTLTNLTWSSFGADGYNTAAIYNDSGGSVTLTILGGTIPTIRNGSGATTTLVINPVNISINITDATTSANISGARILLTAANATGPLPYQKATRVARSSSTVTATCTAHGLLTDGYAVIKGAGYECNGVHQITLLTNNTFSYTVPGLSLMPSGLTGYWDFSDLSSLTLTGSLINQVNDLSGNGRHFTATGTDRPVSEVNSVLGQAATFSSATQNVMTTSATFADLTAAGAYTIIARCTFASVTSLVSDTYGDGVLFLYGAPGGVCVRKNGSDGYLLAAINDDGGWPPDEANVSATLNTEVLLVGRHTGGDIEVRNGARSPSTVASGNSSPTTETWTMGNAAGGGYWLDGAIGQVLVWDRALSENEISTVLTIIGENTSGAITTTGAALYGITDSGGNLSTSRAYASNQPIIGRARKATTGTLYKTGVVGGTIDHTAGFATSLQLIRDE